MKNWPGTPGSSPPRARRRRTYGPTASLPTTREQLAAHRVSRCVADGADDAPIRSCSDSVASARAFAIAWTAAAAPETVVMHGTRATSAASRIR